MLPDNLSQPACADQLYLVDLAVHDQRDSRIARDEQAWARTELARLCAGCRVECAGVRSQP